MNYLLDTCIIICILNDDHRIKEQHYNKLFAPGNSLYVSEESVRELIIKKSINKLDPNIDISTTLLNKVFIGLGIKVINYSDDLYDKYLSLQLFSDHKDPSDRFIISQALLDNLMLVTLDKKFDRYSGLKLLKL